MNYKVVVKKGEEIAKSHVLACGMLIPTPSYIWIVITHLPFFWQGIKHKGYRMIIKNSMLASPPVFVPGEHCNERQCSDLFKQQGKTVSTLQGNYQFATSLFI